MPVLPDSVLNRMQAAIDAEHAHAQVGQAPAEVLYDGEPNAEPRPRVTWSRSPSRRGAKRPLSPSGMGPDFDVVPDEAVEPEGVAEPPRPEQALRVAKALRADESLRAAQTLRAAEELRAAEAARGDAAEPESESAADRELAPVPYQPPPPVESALQAAPPRAAELSSAPRPTVTAAFDDQPAPSSIAWLWPDDTATGGGSQRWQPPGRWNIAGRWPYRTATLVALAAVVLAGAGLVIGMSLGSSPAGTSALGATPGAQSSAQQATATGHKRPAGTPTHGGSAGGGSAAAGGSPAPKKPATKPKPSPNPALAPNRTAAAGWITQQVGAGAVIACDVQACAALTSQGFPGQRVLIGATSKSLSNAGLVIVTPELRTLFAATSQGLGADVAPTILARFGTGSAEVTVQVVYPAGAAAYESALSQSVQARKTAGEQLLNSGEVSATAAARSDLTAGAVDQRLLLVIKALTKLEPVAVVGFADAGPGASAGIPFRVMVLAETDPAASVSGTAYLQAMLRLLQAHVGFPAFMHAAQTTLNGHKVVQVEYAAPSSPN